ncbi:MAG TPA: preprotein translocase subunit SecE [bacterium]|jgi:preprotein translocase subunit SecE
MIEKITRFLQDVRVEMSKVSWPTRKELKGTTVIVIVITMILSVFIFLTDKVLEGLLKFIY